MKPEREQTTNKARTHMVTWSRWERRSLFQAERRAGLLIDTLYHYRPSTYFLHEFIVMPDRFHALITPQADLEKAVQFIKGGFSYRAKKELGSNREVWQKGFQGDEPVAARLDGVPFQSKTSNQTNDAAQSAALQNNILSSGEADGAAELSSIEAGDAAEGAALQNTAPAGALGASLQNKIPNGTAEAAPVQRKAKTA